MYLCVRFVGPLAGVHQKEEDPPLVVAHRGEVADLNRAARKLGLVFGPMPERARLVDMGVQVVAYNEKSYARVQRGLQTACLALTPRVQSLGSALFLLEVPEAGPALEALARQGDGIWAGLGKTAFFARARLHVRAGPKVGPRRVVFSGSLAKAPVGTVELYVPAVSAALQKGGFGTLGTLRGKDPAELAPWIGMRAAPVLALINGSGGEFTPDPPVPRYLHSCSFEPGVAERSLLEQALRRGVAQLCSALQQDGRAACEIRLRLEGDGGRTEESLRLLRPTARVERVHALLSRLLQKAKVAEPVGEACLEVTDWEAACWDTGGLFGRGAAPARRGGERDGSRREARLVFFDPWRRGPREVSGPCPSFTRR